MPTDTPLPHNVEAEESVIGSVLIDPEIIDFIQLAPEDFYIHRHRFIWASILAVHRAGLAIDFITVTNELERQKYLAEIGGGAALTEIMSRVPDSYHAESYAEIVRNAATQRRYIELASNMVKQAHNGGVDTATAISLLSDGSKGSQDGRQIGPALDDLEEFVMMRRANPVEVWGIPTGFRKLDLRTAGLHKQRVLILSGESGTGKTTLALQMMLHAALNDYGVVIFEQEMPEQATLIRLIELHCGVPYRAMMSGYISDQQVRMFNEAKKELESKHIYICDDVGISTVDMRGIIARTKANIQPVDVIMHDYLGLLTDEPAYGKGDYDQTAAKNLRKVVRDQDVACVTIQDMVKTNEAPKMQSMSGGAKVRFGADEIYFIVKDDQVEDAHYLIPAKERYGDSAKKFIPIERNGLGFVDSDREIKTVDLSAVV